MHRALEALSTSMKVDENVVKENQKEGLYKTRSILFFRNLDNLFVFFK